MKLIKYMTAMVLGVAASGVIASSNPSGVKHLASLDIALPAYEDISTTHPVFDFDGDGCLPSAGIGRDGAMNGGLNTSGDLGGGCRKSDFLNYSNTLHRYMCKNSSGDQYCVHFYSLYFMKDQIISNVGGGHRHDWEHAAVWTKNGTVTHGSYSAHGDLNTKPASELPFENGHLKIVYHKDGGLTHALRFAKSNETAENPYGYWVLPPLVSWYTVTGDGVSNSEMRNKMNSYNYGSATIPMKDGNFVGNVNNYKPSDYPTFTRSDMTASQ